MLAVHDSDCVVVVISGEDVCCSVVFSILVAVSVFSVIWSELLMKSVISCPLWSSVVRTERGMFVMCCMQCCIYVSKNIKHEPKCANT